MNLDNFTTPCFIFDEAEFERSVRGFGNALRRRFSSVALGYSVKTNSLPAALVEARKLGCLAEVVSADEYQLARGCGYEPSQIIYNGPMKSKQTFLECIVGGGIVNIEAKREIGWLAELPANEEFKVGLRLNINITDVSPEDADGDDDNSRFGFSEVAGEFKCALEAISTLPNVALGGLHIHRTTHSRNPRFYERSVAYAASVISRYGLRPNYLDVGGGYFGIFPNKPTFDDYSEVIYKSLAGAGLADLKIIIEPGNALTASAFSFLSEVIDVKRVDSGTFFATTDGSRNDVDPFFRKTDYIKEIIYKDKGRPVEPSQIVAGCTCLEYDRLFILADKPRLAVGDRILYKNVGAYTLTLSPQFIRMWPRVYLCDTSGSYRLVRRPGCASDILISNQS